MQNANNNVKVPKEHPIINAIMLFILIVLIVNPLIIWFISKAVNIKNEDTIAKNQETIGEILEYNVITDSRGTAIQYNTKIKYDIDNVTYMKLFQTTYYIANTGQKVKMYYTKGNPYSVDVVYTIDKFGVTDKIRVYMGLTALAFMICIFKAYVDVIKYRERQRIDEKRQIEFNNVNNINK